MIYREYSLANAASQMFGKDDDDTYFWPWKIQKLEDGPSKVFLVAADYKKGERIRDREPEWIDERGWRGSTPILLSDVPKNEKYNFIKMILENF